MTDSSVLKALAILDALGTTTDGKRLTELARDLGFPVSTTHRLLSTLAVPGYVQQDKMSSRFIIGSRVLRLQAISSSRRNLARAAFPFLRKLVREVDETANVGTLSDGWVVYLATVTADRAVGLYLPPGTVAPAHCTAMGKLMLSHLSESELDHMLATGLKGRATPDRVVDQDRLKHQCAEILRAGYAIDDGEWVAGVRCVAGPIRDHTGKVVAAASVSAPAGRFTTVREPDVITAVMQTCAEISAGLGYQNVS